MVLILSLNFVLIGILGLIMSRRNIIGYLIAIEIILLSANFNFVVVGMFIDDSMSLIFSMVILSLAGVEAALGLSILIIYYRLRGILTSSFIVALKG
jgi:NADH:ubiquinone oxidoreductase subunit K